jgi:uncharacterized protein
MSQPSLSAKDFEYLLNRFDAEYLGLRLRRQVDTIARFYGPGLSHLHLENLDFLKPVLDLGLRLVGLRDRALKNAFRPIVTEHQFFFRRIPNAFSGLRILHLSDLHIDCKEPGQSPIREALVALIKKLHFDLCVITGDFRFKSFGPYHCVAEEMEMLASALSCREGIFAVLGNHDLIEQVPALERLGIRVLLNESASLEQEGQRIWLVGLDDPHFYGTHDVNRALKGVPEGAFQLWLVHSPELANEAARRRATLYLSGHTHGGQLCLPGGAPLYRNVKCPSRLQRGRWLWKNVQGYTSSGVGASLWPGRLNCPAEVAIHELWSAQRG